MTPWPFVDFPCPLGSNSARFLLSSAGGVGGEEMARMLIAILLGVVVAACALPKDTEWAGVISGGGCYGFSIEITIDNDGVIVGKATHHHRGELWAVTGMVHKSGNVYMRVVAQEQHQRDRLFARGYSDWMVYTGQLTGNALFIAQRTSQVCDPPRRGVLNRL